jgi:hypothetical protein
MSAGQARGVASIRLPGLLVPFNAAARAFRHHRFRNEVGTVQSWEQSGESIHHVDGSFMDLLSPSGVVLHSLTPRITDIVGQRGQNGGGVRQQGQNERAVAASHCT